MKPTPERRAWRALSAPQRQIVLGMWKHIREQKHQVFRSQLYLSAEDMFKERALALALALYTEEDPLKCREHEQSLRQIGAAWTWLRAKVGSRQDSPDE